MDRASGAATRDEFECLARVLYNVAVAEYQNSSELSPRIVAMGLDPEASEVTPGYRFCIIPVSELMTSNAGVPGEVVVAALVEKLVKDPEVLVVGHVSEAWLCQYTKEARALMGAIVNPADEADREEVLLMNLRSEALTAIKTCKLIRDGEATTVVAGELLFATSAAAAGGGPKPH